MAVAMTASQAQEQAQPRVSARATFESPNPATGQPIATFLVHQRADADMAVSRAREAARWWGALDWRERRSRLLDSTRSRSPARRPPRGRSWPPRRRTWTPVIAECGGKDALIVDADADLSAAAGAAAWGALSNAGQTCVGIERVYVADPVYETFLAKLANRVSRLRPGSDDGADYGPLARGLLAWVGAGPGLARGLGWRGRGRGGGSRPAAAGRERSPGSPMSPRDSSGPRMAAARHRRSAIRASRPRVMTENHPLWRQCSSMSLLTLCDQIMPRCQLNVNPRRSI